MASSTVKNCLECKKPFNVLISELKRGHGLFCSRGCRNSLNRGLKRSPEARIKMSEARIGRFGGEKHPLWKGGISTLKHRMRGWNQWSEWREFIFKRDSYRCIDCGEGGYLEPHHIIPLKADMTKAFDKNNGITLCRPCHVKILGKELQLARTYHSLVQVHY